MRNSRIREINVTVPEPYIESIQFESEGLQPLYMTVRDTSEATFYLDISNKSRLGLVDSEGNSMLLNSQGLYFATNSCRYDVNITINDLYAQLARLSDLDCAFGNGSVPKPPPITKRNEDIQFNQTLYLYDQCGEPVTKSIREYPRLRVGDTACQDVAVDEESGQWDFDCTFPGSYSGTLRCQKTVQDDVVDFLLVDPFGGECPGLSSMITTLANSSQDVINSESLRAGLVDADDQVDEDDVDLVVGAYEDLWAALQEFFIASGPEGNRTSPWERYISVYNTHRSIQNDICEDLHADEIPLSLGLRVGASDIDAITTLNWAPPFAREYNLTVQDPSTFACCSAGSVAENQGEDTCAYPDDAFVEDTACICGQTVGGQSLAFEATECANFDDTCESDDDCESAGYVCLTGTCCGGGVCVDPYACSQNGTALVKFGDEG